MPFETEIRIARANVLAWMRWYKDTHVDEVPSWAAFARKIGVSPSAVNQWLAPGSTR